MTVVEDLVKGDRRSAVWNHLPLDLRQATGIYLRQEVLDTVWDVMWWDFRASVVRNLE